MEISAQGINASAGIQRSHLPAQRVFAIDRLIVLGCVLSGRMDRMLCCKKQKKKNRNLSLKCLPRFRSIIVHS